MHPAIPLFGRYIIQRVVGNSRAMQTWRMSHSWVRTLSVSAQHAQVGAWIEPQATYGSPLRSPSDWIKGHILPLHFTGFDVHRGQGAGAPVLKAFRLDVAGDVLIPGLGDELSRNIGSRKWRIHRSNKWVGNPCSFTCLVF